MILSIVRTYRKYQNSTDLLIRKAPFIRLVREIAQEVSTSATPLRFQASALEALQHSCEAYITDLFSDSMLAATHGESYTRLSHTFACKADSMTSTCFL